MKIFFKGLFYTLSILAFYVILFSVLNLLNYYNVLIIREEPVRVFISFIFTVIFAVIEIFLKVQETEKEVMKKWMFLN